MVFAWSEPPVWYLYCGLVAAPQTAYVAKKEALSNFSIFNKNT